MATRTWPPPPSWRSFLLASLVLLAAALSAARAQSAATAAAAASAALPPAPLANYEVRLLDRGDDAALAAMPMSALSPRNARVTMRSASGAAFTCFVPPDASGGSGGGGGAGGAAGAPAEDARAARARTAAALLAAEPGQRCVLRREGFWTVEVCAGLHVRQFHLGGASGDTGGGGGSGGGGGGAAAGLAVGGPSTTASAAAQLTAADSARNLLGAHEAGADELVLSAAGSLALRQSFGGGDGGRRATVDFECEPPGMAPGLEADLVSIREAPPLHYALVVGTRSAAVCEQLASVRRLLAPLNQTCFEHTEGWWTYEVCAGLRIRQYHAEAQTGRAVQESLIGVFDWRRGAHLQPAGVGTAAALAQHFHLGTPCDIRGGVPREATLRFECVPQPELAGGGGGGGVPVAGSAAAQQLTLISIREAPSCVYTVSLGAAAVCAHPDVSPNKAVVAQPPPTQIYCVSDEEMGGEL
jgi:hypothetical protein